ncbi:hypothetical protein [Helicobacter cynogastricus]|uniref:hypothetical protein n=1 Tax=Helicobacter cynogastricus TaxID=329937 RepID=UPI000CF142B6|nr:hypothetical protein [Helicobacter cynogastricus]
MRGFFCAMALFGCVAQCSAHPKDGFFLEGGFMTGMLDSVENLHQKPSCGFSVICPKEFMLNASALFTNQDITNPTIRFSTTAPVKITLSPQGLKIQNFLPYTLNNVAIYMKTPQGREIKVGTITTLPKFTQTWVNSDILPALANAPLNSSFSVQSTNASDSTTQNVLNALGQISVDLNLSFLKAPDSKWLTPTPKQAKELTDIMLNLAYLLSSTAFENNVLKAPFHFYNDVNKDGQPVGIIPPQKVLEVYRSSANIALGILSSVAGEERIEGLGGPGLLGVQPYLINSQSVNTWTNYKTGWQWPMEVILHEFGHTKGYGHEGNMTYGRNGEGLVELGIKAWKQLGEANKLPINYTQIAQVPNPIYNSSFIQALSHSLPSEGVSTDAMVGFNLKSGYQKYFNNVIGLAYYGVIKYNFSKRLGYIKQISQVGVGVGIDALVDFKTTYKTNYARVRTKKGKHTRISKKVFQSAVGMFVGMRGFWDSYILDRIYKPAWNVDAVAGLNYRYKHSKYSLGVSLPLVQKPLHFAIDTQKLIGSMTLYDGVRHFNIFFNYGWVF